MPLNFFQLLVKRMPYGIALFFVFIFWGIIMALFFGGPIVISQFDFEATGTKIIFWLNLLVSVALVMIYAQLKFGFYRKFGCKLLEMKEARILNEYIIKGRIPSDVSDQNLLELAFALRKIIAKVLHLNFWFVVFVIAWVAVGEYFASGGQFKNIPIILAGGIIGGISCFMLVSLSCELCTAQVRRECRELLNKRKIKQEEAHLFSLKNRIILFPTLIILIEVTILIVAYPFDSVLLLTSLMGLIVMIMLSSLILSSFYKPILEIRNSANKIREGREMSFFSGSLIREIMDLSESLRDTSEELKEAKNVLEIKVEARTKQLKEVVAGLDEQVKERTKKLEDSKEALINILRDFKEEKSKAEEEKEKTLAIIRNFSDGLLIFDNKDKLLISNAEAEKFLNLNKKEIIGKSVSELSEFHDMKLLFNIVGKNIKEVFRKELKIEEDLIIEVSAAFIIRDNERIGKFILLHDITREKTVQKLKTEFVSIAAHQLRTPLSAIKWTLTTILDGDLGKINKEQKEYLQKTNLSNERMINLVDDLLNLSRIEEGRYVQKNDFFKLGEVVQDIIDSLDIKANKKSIKFNFKKSANMPEVLADKEKIRLVVQNLLDNAVNYSFNGKEIFISLSKNDNKNEIEFKVENVGIGIPKNQQKRIFTKFFRAENAVKAETVGSGLGLFINKNIIKSHKGRIWFESGKNEKTAFYFTIPVKSLNK
ncbi:GHKL domain-containing protein [Patescibacteria group bacterium]|nr:GHKL domain-containing protein [Patescibacteria group bacterium]